MACSAQLLTCTYVWHKSMPPQRRPCCLMKYKVEKSEQNCASWENNFTGKCHKMTPLLLCFEIWNRVLFNRTWRWWQRILTICSTHKNWYDGTYKKDEGILISNSSNIFFKKNVTKSKSNSLSFTHFEFGGQICLYVFDKLIVNL